MHAAGKSVTVAVEKDARARTLYRRVGFHEIADHSVHWDMEQPISPRMSLEYCRLGHLPAAAAH
jgi:hypothetical protein